MYIREISNFREELAKLLEADVVTRKREHFFLHSFELVHVPFLPQGLYAVLGDNLWTG